MSSTPDQPPPPLDPEGAPCTIYHRPDGRREASTDWRRERLLDAATWQGNRVTFDAVAPAGHVDADTEA